MRLFALAQAAQDRFDVLFIYKTCTVNLLNKLEKEGFATQKVTTPLTVNEIVSLNVTVLVIDDYSLSQAEWVMLHTTDIYVVALDDNLSTDKLLADFVVNPASNFNLAGYKQRAPTAEFCLGPQYAYLRKEFTVLTDVAFQSRGNILVTLGGTDTKSLALPICQSLLSLPIKSNIQLLLGKEHQQQPALMQLQAAYGNFSIVVDPDSVAKHMMQAGLAISAAGGTLGELASLGVPTIALVTVDNQISALESIYTETWYKAIDVRSFDDTDNNVRHNSHLLHTIIELVEELWRDNCLRQSMSEQARQLVDAHGCQRVIDKLTDCLEMRLIKQ